MSQLPLDEADLLEHENRFLKANYCFLAGRIRKHPIMNHESEVQEILQRKSEDEKSQLR